MDGQYVPLYWGAHFSNDLNWIKGAKAMKKRGPCQKNNNAKVEVIFIMSTAIIKTWQEIFVDYNFDDNNSDPD